jgi:L-fuculose-phosphate aldolase
MSLKYPSNKGVTMNNMSKFNTFKEVCNELVESKFIRGSGGNASIRFSDFMYITESGKSLTDMSLDKLVKIHIETGEITESNKNKVPSSEYLMHLYCYRKRPEINTILHTHPVMVQSVCTNPEINLEPMFADYYVFLGKNVPHLNYITVTTSELALAVSNEIKNSSCAGIVMRNHGILTVGESPNEALYRTYAMEENARIQYNSMLINNGQIFSLSEESQKELDELESEKYRIKLLKEID